MRFQPSTLVEKWQRLARLRGPGFAWDGADYPSSRSQAPAPGALELHAQALLELAALAPNGYPKQSDLRDVLSSLHKQHRIFDVAEKTLPKAIDIAADAWRVMMKHCSLVASSTKEIAEPTRSKVVVLMRTHCSGLSSADQEDDDEVPAVDGAPPFSAEDVNTCIRCLRTTKTK